MNQTNHLAFLLDQSGSMSSGMHYTMDSFNRFLQSQKAEIANLKVTMTLFNGNRVEVRYDKTDIEKVEALTSANYRPRGSTPLWDAIDQSVNALEGLRDVMFVILTDGQENASRRVNGAHCKRLLDTMKREFGWKIVFLGADLTHSREADFLDIRDRVFFQKADSERAYHVLCRLSEEHFAQPEGRPDVEAWDVTGLAKGGEKSSPV